MAVDKIVREFWDDKCRGYCWVRESGDTTTVFQAQGLDIVVRQTRDSKDYNAWCYSNPGLMLFAAMLKYHKQVTGKLPPLDEIQNVFGERIPSRESGFPVDRIGMDMIFKNDFPVAGQGRVVLAENQMVHTLGGYMGGIGYTGFIEDGAFVISVPDVGQKLDMLAEQKGRLQKIMTLNRSIILHPDCATRLMKTINFFYLDKEVLESAYRQAENPKKDWIYEGL